METKNVDIKIMTTLSQEELEKLMTHLKQLEDFNFLIKAKIYMGYEEDKSKKSILSALTCEYLPTT